MNYLDGTRLRNRLRPGRQELGSQGTAKGSWSRHRGRWKHTLDAAAGPTEGDDLTVSVCHLLLRCVSKPRCVRLIIYLPFYVSY